MSAACDFAGITTCQTQVQWVQTRFMRLRIFPIGVALRMDGNTGVAYFGPGNHQGTSPNSGKVRYSIGHRFRRRYCPRSPNPSQ
jgi:hypothetical protein